MNGFRDQLLDLHAAYSCDELERVPAYEALCQAYEGQNAFEELRDLVAKVNSGFEGGLRDADDTRGQVIAALETAKLKLRRPDWRETCRELAHRRWEDTWSPEQLAYFDAALDKLGQGDDVFLSFTYYNPSAPDGINVVNTRYQELITTGGGLAVERPDGVNHNLVAKMLRNKFSERQLRVFHWEEEQDPSAVVTERLTRKVDGALVFLQLVQSQLFERDPDETPNYCLLEYKAANTDPTRVLVLLIEPYDHLIQPEDIEFGDFDNWYEGITQRTLIQLQPVRTYAESVAEIDRIVAIVKAQREAARDRLIQGVPA